MYIKTQKAAVIGLATLALTACVKEKTAVVDATSYDSYTYFNLNTNAVVELTDEEAAASTDWHLGFKRFGVILNGGDSGPGAVSGALAAAQDDFYIDGEPNVDVFLAATPAGELDHLKATYDLSTLSFLVDTKQSAIAVPGTISGTVYDLGWFNYDLVTHQISLNSENWWLLRSNNGDAFAKFHATALTYNPAVGLDVTFEFDVQPSGSASFTQTATFNAVLPPAGGEVCFDFDTDTQLDCANDQWDLKLDVAGRDWNLWTNSGVSGSGSGGAFGPLDTATANTYTSGTHAPTGELIVFLYQVDKSAGVFEESSWYAYNLQGGHKLWPNFRTYIIDTDNDDEASVKYKFQITDYYSEGGASGHVSIRHLKVK
ncbi:MAG: hypothetical protein CSA49_02250 [Gammaproteobacteria bacterium]|nr:MAG: hypothetical protein CSA49_02250 [Gammaproteobacteria bacterium]